jgi:hypothetical protein
MYRWGDKEKHSYVIGTYTSIEHAKLAGACEESWRGGKYEYEVQEFKLDSTIPQEIWENHYGLYTKN